MNRPYYVVEYSYGEICGIFATQDEAIAQAKRYHDESKRDNKTDYVVEYREEIFCTKPPLAKAG